LKVLGGVWGFDLFPAWREAKRIRATFTNPVEMDWESAGGFVKLVKIRTGVNPPCYYAEAR